jgi:phage tail sheath gpL-like
MSDIAFPQSGAVAYQLYNGNNASEGAPTGPRVGLMMAQMLTDDTLRIEIFNDTTSTARAFTDAAWRYER